MQLLNRTPFQAAMFVDMSREGVETLAVLVKATYQFGDGDEPQLADVQRKPMFSDAFAGEPGCSSLLYESDANWGRSATDIAFIGHACAPGRPVRELDIGLQVGDLVKTARVFGDRQWTTRMGFACMSDPEPFERVPVLYERAFGGIDTTSQGAGESRNPVGTGFRSSHSAMPVDGVRLPNIEDPSKLIGSVDDKPAPVGFSFVSKAWTPRVGYAGTYDERWQSSRMPLLPEDFDPRFYQAASNGLCAPGFLQGGEEVHLLNLGAGGRRSFALPSLRIEAATALDAQVMPIALNLDMVLIDAAHSMLVLAWHGSRPVHGMVDDIQWIEVTASQAS
jgi:hypothetical protein